MKRKRLFNLDLIRTFGLLFIIFNHALNTVWDATNYSYWLDTTIIEKVFILIGYSICRLGVPLFLMITGSLILNKKFETKEDIIHFYKSNLFNLVIVIMIWNIIYYIFNMFYYESSFSLKDLLYVLLFMKTSPMPRMWYMSMIVGMYLALPYISVVVKKFNFKSMLVPLITIITFFFLIPNLKTFLTFLEFKGTNIKTILDLNFFGGTYGIYIILVYYVYNQKIFENIKTKYLVMGTLFWLAISCVFQMIGYMNHSGYIIYYNFIGILVSGTLLFEILRRNEKCLNKYLENKITEISKFALGIYFVHRPLLFIGKKYLILNFNPCINVMIYYIVAIIISYFIVLTFSKIKIFKKYLFLVKD